MSSFRESSGPRSIEIDQGGSDSEEEPKQEEELSPEEAEELRKYMIDEYECILREDPDYRDLSIEDICKRLDERRHGVGKQRSKTAKPIDLFDIRIDLQANLYSNKPGPWRVSLEGDSPEDDEKLEKIFSMSLPELVKENKKLDAQVENQRLERLWDITYKRQNDPEFANPSKVDTLEEKKIGSWFKKTRISRRERKDRKRRILAKTGSNPPSLRFS